MNQSRVNIIGKTVRKFRGILQERRELKALGITGIGLLFGKSNFRTSYAMRLSAVYRCVTCISDAVSQLPVEILRVDSEGYKKRDRKTPVFSLLNARPNVRMTRYTFMSLMVQSMLLEGNGYAYIKRNGREIEQLVYIPSSYVSIVAPASIFEPVRYRVTGMRELVDHTDMIHLVNQSIDGVTGVSVLEYARHTLGLSWDAEKHASNFFASGCGIGGILKSNKILNDAQLKQIKESWHEAYGSDHQHNGVAVLGADLTYQPVTLNAKDAQLLETRQFNVIDICRFFGVSPVKAFDLSKSSYSTVEATNIGFLTDTIGPLLEKIELELETKLFGTDGSTDVRFDVSQILRADKAALATYYSTMFHIGAIDPNEIRREIDLPRIEGGDEKFVPVNLQPLKKAIREKEPEDPGDEGSMG